MASFIIEQPPFGTEEALAEYLSRMMTLINIALGQNAQLIKYSVLPQKPSVGKLYFFTQAIPTTAITQEGFWGYTSAGYVLLG